jgi:hypothetical protein
MLPIVPHPTRIKAVTLTAVIAAMSVGCGSTTAMSSPVDGVLSEIPDFTVTEICPADVDAALAGQQFNTVSAGMVSQNGDVILRVLAGQLKSGDSGDAFVHKYLQALSNKTRVGAGLPSNVELVGGHAVTHFNVPLTAEGYTYSDGQKVVIAYVAFGSPPATVDDALAKLLDNVG